MSKRIGKITPLVLGLGFFLWVFGLDTILGSGEKNAPKNFTEESFLPGHLYVENEILAKFKPEVTAQGIRSLMADYGLQLIERIPRINVLRIRTKDQGAFERTLAALKDSPSVEYASPNYLLSLAATPNDPYFQYQWAFRNIGQTVGPLERYPFRNGTPGRDVKATEAWELSTGSVWTLVGVVDTGIDIGHPDLVNNIASPGKDFFNNDDDAQDDHGHGTHVAGTIAAEGNNNLGVSGFCWKAKILPAKVFDLNAKGPTSAVINGIIWVTDQGVRAINMSLGGPDIVVTQALADAIRYAYEKGVVLVAAAGNQGTPGVWYPAAYEDYVLAAAATDFNDTYMTLQTTDGSWGSNYGPEVDVAAPGYFILSTWGRGLNFRGRPGWSGYNYGNKTSMSTAFVTGLAALLLSYHPELNNRQVMDIIRYSSDDINAAQFPGKDIYIGWGRINAHKALRLADLILNRPKIPRPIQ